jgi:hypothetical protein
MNLLKKIWFLLTCFDLCPFIHRWKIKEVHRFDEYIQKLYCVRCGKYFVINKREHSLVPWNDSMEKYYCEMYGISRTNKESELSYGIRKETDSF